MQTHPIMQPHVEIIPFPLEWASGRMSSATMKIMAPAANANPMGRIVDATETASAPEEFVIRFSFNIMSFSYLALQKSAPPSLKVDHTRNSFRVKIHLHEAEETPPNLLGSFEFLEKEFCEIKEEKKFRKLPIPMARFLAASKVAFCVDPIAPKLTPTARPSENIFNFIIS